MNILFFHPHFPNSFAMLAQHLAMDPNNHVLFLSERGRKDVRMPNVRRISLAPAPLDPRNQDMPSREMGQALERAATAANVLLRLQRDGFTPDIVYASASLGYSLYIRDVFPRSALALYAHWYYTKGENYTFFTRGRERPAADFAPARVRNLLQLNGLMDCDMAVTSTEWQKRQYPEQLQEKFRILPEGVDVRYFAPSPGACWRNPEDNAPIDELVTFSARNRESLNGLNQFYAMLPRLFALRPRCHALIMTPPPPLVDKDGVPYTRRNEDKVAVAHHEALRRCRDQAVAAGVDLHRVHTAPITSAAGQRMVLQASAVHVYLMPPFTLSAGLLEAMSCGCLVIGSDTPPVREVIHEGENGLLCDYWDTAALADKIAMALEHRAEMAAQRRAARALMEREHNVEALVLQHADLLMHLRQQTTKA